MELYYGAVNLLRAFVLLVGSVMIFSGIALAAFETIRGGSSRQAAQQIGTHASLGLEFFIGAGILNLILNPTWAAVGSAALTIVVRRLLTYSLGRSAQGG